MSENPRLYGVWSGRAPVLPRAACAGEDTELWFARDTAAAVAVCRSCPERAPCLEYAIAEGIKYGVWGGERPEDRARRRAA